MTGKLLEIVPQQKPQSKKEIELLKCAHELVALLESEKTKSVSDVYSIINKIIKIIGPSYANIPTDMKRGLGVAYASALGETEIGAKAAYTRSALSLLRGAVKIARGPKSQLNTIDNYIYTMEQEMKNIEEQGEEAMLDKLWAKTNRTIDYITLMSFNGYGELNSKGFNFTKDDKERLK
jgi:hypothetical protein